LHFYNIHSFTALLNTVYSTYLLVTILDEYSVLIKNAKIVDGSGKPSVKGSIGIIDDKIVSVGDVKGDAAEVIEAEGLTALPGFIDSHSHHDHWLLQFPKCESYLLQGITTFIAGQCGTSPAPIGDLIQLDGISFGSDFMQDLIRFKYYPKNDLFPRDQVNEMLEKRLGYVADWKTMGEFFKKVEETGITCNYVPLLGHRNVRSHVLGRDYERVSTKAEVEEMGELVHQAMRDGCYGMSVGLDYDPDVFADRYELVKHVSILKDYDAIFVPHSRRTGRRRGMGAGHKLPNKIDAIREVIEICRESGVKMNIAHLFTGWYLSPEDAPEIVETAIRKATLMDIDGAIKEGLDISFDVIPQVFKFNYGRWEYLCSQFLPWLRELETREKFAEWLKVSDFREELKTAIKDGKWFIRVPYNPNTNPSWDENITILEHKQSEYNNKTIREVAKMRNADGFDTWLDLIVEDPDSKCGLSMESNPEASYHSVFLKHKSSAVGLDTYVDDYKYVSGVAPWFIPWVSSYSSLPGFYVKYVKEEKIFTLEDAVFKTSTQAAIRHNIKNRGTLFEGSYADIVLLDMKKLHVTGTPLEPRNRPVGIEYVLVNGKLAVKESELTKNISGRVLRKS